MAARLKQVFHSITSKRVKDNSFEENVISGPNVDDCVGGSNVTRRINL